jgi:glycosyltransferase involved in cell wall biosynthesis
VIAVNETLKRFLVDQGLDPLKVSVVGSLLPHRLHQEDLPAQWQAFVDLHSPVIVSVGAETSDYDFGTILRAFGRIRTTHRRAGLILVSTGFAQEKSIQREIEQLASILNRSVMLLRDIPHAALLRFIANADLLVRGVRHESYGLTKVESIMLGTPVVSTNTGESRGCALYEFGDDAQLADVSFSVLSNSGRIDMRAVFEAEAWSNYRMIIKLYERSLH